MLKKVTKFAGSLFTGVRKKFLTASLSVGAAALSFAPSSFAENADLDTVTTSLVDGAGDMKTNAMTLIIAIIAIIIVVFGIGWLIGIFKRNMNKA